jgi:hypothetical protein
MFLTYDLDMLDNRGFMEYTGFDLKSLGPRGCTSSILVPGISLYARSELKRGVRAVFFAVVI